MRGRAALAKARRNMLLSKLRADLSDLSVVAGDGEHELGRALSRSSTPGLVRNSAKFHGSVPRRAISGAAGSEPACSSDGFEGA